MSDLELPLRAGTAQDWDAVSRLLFTVFHEPFDEELREGERPVYEPARSLIAEDHDLVVAHTGAYTRELSVPGGVLPAAYVTQVGVYPTHRRRRLLTRMMHRQLREIHAAAREPVAVLWASEGRIYQRFGYGLGAQQLALEIDSREVGMPPAGPGATRLRPVDPLASWTDFASVYDRLRGSRPGWASRDERWWRYVLADPASRRHGGTEQSAVVVDGPDGIDGYALWRVRTDEKAAGSTSEVHVREVVAADPAAYRELWRFLLSIDLTWRARYPFGAVDEPLQHLVEEPRRLGGRLRDSLWVRLVDLPTALVARRYASAVDVVLAVTDPLLPENTGHWHLVSDGEKTSCEPTDAPADLSCEVRELGAAYLGGTSLTALAAAGRVDELRPGALTAASAAFGWHRSPVAIEVF